MRRRGYANVVAYATSALGVAVRESGIEFEALADGIAAGRIPGAEIVIRDQQPR